MNPIQVAGLLLLGVYVYAVLWRIHRALNPIPQSGVEFGKLDMFNALAFIIGTFAVAGFLAGAAISTLMPSFDGLSETIGSLIGFACLWFGHTRLQALEHRSLKRMKDTAHEQAQEVISQLQLLSQERISQCLSEFHDKYWTLRKKLPHSGPYGRQLTRNEWIELWRNEEISGFDFEHTLSLSIPAGTKVGPQEATN